MGIVDGAGGRLSAMKSKGENQLREMRSVLDGERLYEEEMGWRGPAYPDSFSRGRKGVDDVPRNKAAIGVCIKVTNLLYNI